jgi:hypothetical protein
MSETGAAIRFILFIIIFTTWCVSFYLILSDIRDSTTDSVRIECLVHRENPAVHELCKGYDK